MRPNHFPTRRTLVVAAMFFASFATLAIANTPVWSIQLVGTSIQGSVVSVRVANVGSSTATGSVAVQAVTTDGTRTSVAPFSLAPGQTAWVSVGFAKPVSAVTGVSVTPLGMTDDLQPF